MRKHVFTLFPISILMKVKLKIYVEMTKSQKSTCFHCWCNLKGKEQRAIKIIVPKRIIKRIKRKKVIQRRVEKKRKKRRNVNTKNIKIQRNQNRVL